MIEWNGPTTEELTKIVKKISFPFKNSESTLIEFICETLLENGYEKEELNFETIINVIEELSIYYSEFNKDKQTPSLLRVFLKDYHLETKFDYSIDGDKRKHGYKLMIPNGKEYMLSKKAYHGENPTQFYLQHVLSRILTDISHRISGYSYHTETKSVIEEDLKISRNFQKWMAAIYKNHILRIYTLNYDRIFKILLDEININCFEGFDSSVNRHTLEGIRCNIPRIINDFNANTFYNLHGSAFWRVVPRNKWQLAIPEIVFTGFPHLQINDDITNLQIERGKPLYLSNIITGYQKAQKSMISPFSQLHSAFDRDCHIGSKIYIIGYSFNDEHVNECIKIALRHNKNLSLEIVDPNFIKNNLDEKLMLTIFQYIESEKILPKKISTNKYSYFNDQIIVYTLKFGEYLKIKTNN